MQPQKSHPRHKTTWHPHHHHPTTPTSLQQSPLLPYQPPPSFSTNPITNFTVQDLSLPCHPDGKKKKQQTRQRILKLENPPSRYRPCSTCNIRRHWSTISTSRRRSNRTRSCVRGVTLRYQQRLATFKKAAPIAAWLAHQCKH